MALQHTVGSGPIGLATLYNIELRDDCRPMVAMNEIIMVDSTASHDRYLCECEICRDLATRWDEEEERQVMKAREEKEAQGQLENEDEDEDEAEDEYDDEDEDENAYTMSKEGMELDGHTSDQHSFH